MSKTGYEPGKTYEIATIHDLIAVWRQLPDDRAELMMSELLSAVRQAGAYFNLLEAFGVTVSDEQNRPMRWVDDDKGETEVNTFTADGAPVLSFKSTRGQEASDPASSAEGIAAGSVPGGQNE